MPTNGRAHLVHLINEAVGKDYMLVKEATTMQMRLRIYVHVKHREGLANISMDTENTGLGHVRRPGLAGVLMPQLAARCAAAVDPGAVPSHRRHVGASAWLMLACLARALSHARNLAIAFIFICIAGRRQQGRPGCGLLAI